MRWVGHMLDKSALYSPSGVHSTPISLFEMYQGCPCPYWRFPQKRGNRHVYLTLLHLPRHLPAPLTRAVDPQAGETDTRPPELVLRPGLAVVCGPFVVTLCTVL